MVRMVTALTMALYFILLWFGGQGTPQNGPAPARSNARSPHGALAVPCENCHTLTSFKPIRAVPEFDHGPTRFPLRGMHQAVSCTQCHISMVFSNVGTTCSTCHADIHRGQLGGRCEQCHTANGWTVRIQNIQNHQNRFPLVGAHATAECESCHTGGATAQFSGLSTDCLSCHLQDFQAAKNPDHQALNYSTSCQSCHSMNGWAGAGFDHLRSTGFALTGAHGSLDCASCHVGGRFQGTPANCYGCHASDYTGTSNPNHVQSGFPQQCAVCHNTSTWFGARFDHNTLTRFPLTGAHTTVACANCHLNGNYTNTPSDCYSCHTSEYQGTTDPNHMTANFPTTCQTCHNTSQWTGAASDHTWFPIYSGTHRGEWNTCADCHVNPSNYTQFSCIICHQHSAANTNSDHNGVRGYVYNATSCYSCHPRGDE